MDDCNSTEPAKYSCDEVLNNGVRVHLRAIRPDDKQKLLDAFHHLTDRSIYFRFLAAKKDLSSNELSYFTEVDFKNHVAIVATIPINGAEKIIGIVRYIIAEKKNNECIAELACTVDENFQGIGLGSLLFKHILAIAKQKGVTIFVADVLSENRRVFEIFKHSGFKINSTLEGPTTHLQFRIS